mgnify:CR=1 FL=1
MINEFGEEQPELPFDDCPFCKVPLVPLNPPITGEGLHVGNRPTPVRTWTRKCPTCRLIFE